MPARYLPTKLAKNSSNSNANNKSIRKFNLQVKSSSSEEPETQAKKECWQTRGRQSGKKRGLRGPVPFSKGFFQTCEGR